jgi:hypothetical protein
MGGTTFHNSINYYASFSGQTIFTLHNLDRQYRMLTGHIGCVDGSNMLDAKYSTPYPPLEITE